MAINQVSIALKQNVYNTFRNLVNTIPNTLGEYIDNAIQSYLDNKEQLRSYEPNYKLKIKIIMDWEQKTLSIEDNAAGINEKNYIRAFEPANIPQDNTGLNEYGMGLKTASIWLADNWTVTTKALGEDVERKLSFDLEKITREEKEELSVIETKKPQEEHYTKIELTKFSENAPKTNAMETAKRHLSSIYRKFLKNDEIDIFVGEGENLEKLSFTEHKILYAPFYETPGAEKILWKKSIDFSDGKHKAKGFIGILDEIDQKENGLVLMRRGRVIRGGGYERFFPYCIFGSAGTFKYKRLFGELELEGFEVSFNKNSFKSEGDLQDFLEYISKQIKNEQQNNLFKQAEHYRVRAISEENRIKIAKSLSKDFKKKKKDGDLFSNEKLKAEEEKIKNTEYIKEETKFLEEAKSVQIDETKILQNDKDINIQCELTTTDPKSSCLYSILDKNKDSYVLKINTFHPFFGRFPQFKSANDFKPIEKILEAFARAEIKAPAQGFCMPNSIRDLFNIYIQGDN